MLGVMTATLKRAYKGKDVDMLTDCATIVEQTIVYQDFWFPNAHIKKTTFLTVY